MTQELPQPHQPPHQPRKPAGAAVLRADKTDAIVAAFYDELAENGHEGLSMDRVAARAGVGKAALYRRWPSKERMFVELVAGLGGHDTLAADRGSLPEELVAYFNDASALLKDPLIRRTLPYLISRARSSSELVESLTRLPGPSRESARVMLRRAIDRAELPANVDMEIALDLITSPLIVRGFIQGQTLKSGYTERLAAAILRGIGYVGTASADGATQSARSTPGPAGDG
jgi:AcrR family transcriptional regulator